MIFVLSEQDKKERARIINRDVNNPRWPIIHNIDKSVVSTLVLEQNIGEDDIWTVAIDKETGKYTSITAGGHTDQPNAVHGKCEKAGPFAY